MALYGPQLYAKNQKNLMKRFRENCEKPDFWPFWAHFGHIWARMGRTGIFQNMAFETENDVMDINLHAKNKKNSMDGF